MTSTLFHVSAWGALSDAQAGETFILRPGTQNAEGVGVYFSESAPRLTAAEGAGRSGLAAIIQICATEPDGWWRSKGGKARKFGKPRTWHSDKKQVQITVISIGNSEYGCPILVCDWKFEEYHG
jgi:hypothetical protein